MLAKELALNPEWLLDDAGRRISYNAKSQGMSTYELPAESLRYALARISKRLLSACVETLKELLPVFVEDQGLQRIMYRIQDKSWRYSFHLETEPLLIIATKEPSIGLALKELLLTDASFQGVRTIASDTTQNNNTKSVSVRRTDTERLKAVKRIADELVRCDISLDYIVDELKRRGRVDLVGNISNFL